MNQEVIARPYARALYALARDRGAEEQVAQELGEVLAVWDGNREFREVIRRPEVSDGMKREIVHRTFPDLGDLAKHLLDVVIDKKREAVLSAIYEEYRTLWDESRGVVHANVTTAEELSADQEQDLTNALNQATGRTVKVSIKRDPSLLAGVVVRIGDRVLDGSVARRLTALGDVLRSGDRGGSVVEH